jgi:molybdopterin/thiamine biosynthesis adenylyltransferase
MENASMKRYARHIVLKKIGSAGQKKLLASRVLVIGAGGLGSPAALYLAAAGVGTIGIADGDSVEISNLQRQILYGPDDVGSVKARSARVRLEAFNPDVRVEAYDTFITPENVLGVIEGYDFVIDGTDSASSKFLINDACVMAGKPFVYAGIGSYYGQIMTCLPHETPCCRCAFGEPDETPGRRGGVIGAVCGVIGSLEAMEAIKYILGLDGLITGRLLVYDALIADFRSLKFAGRDPSCPACGDSPAISLR